MLPTEYNIALFEATNKDGSAGSRLRAVPTIPNSTQTTTVFFVKGQRKPNTQQAFRLHDAIFEKRPIAIRCVNVEDGIAAFSWLTRRDEAEAGVGVGK